MVLVFMFHFSGCEKLKVSNLEANYHLKRANELYRDEQYKKATAEYEAALELNPKLEFIYKYLGTCYSQIYRPMKESETNKAYGEKAVENLKMAMELEPDNEKIIVALGDIFDKMGNMEEAEQYYLKIKEKSADNPKTYYTLANFYQKNGKADEAEQMYLQRIELNPEDPDGYHYYVSFLQDHRRWPDLIDIHNKRLYAILDSSIILTMREIEKLGKDADMIEEVTKYMDMVKKNRRVDKEEKERLLAEAEARLEGKLSLEETNNKMKELQAGVEAKAERAVKTIDAMSDEEKQVIAEIYYSIGNVCWNWSYQAPRDFMSAEERDPIIEKGIAALNKAIEISPEYAFPYSYMGLLYREKIKVNPLKKDEYVKMNEEYNKKFIEVYQRKKKSEAYREQLERMGAEVEEEGGDEEGGE
jgi:tetratricopeptide (TPR) repeat protein